MSAERRIYRVEVVGHVYVLATSEREAEVFVCDDADARESAVEEAESVTAAACRAIEVPDTDDGPFLACDYTDDEERWSLADWAEHFQAQERRAAREVEFEQRQGKLPEVLR